MTLTALWKTPFPYWGGKTDAAPAVWQALGDVPHFVEPFAGSLAVLLRRPHLCNRTYYSETVNDADGLLINAWRGIQLHPQETADAASWPVTEADLHARHLALLRWRANHDLERLMGDPAWCDPVMAGWWIWGTCCWIGGGWCDGSGPWVVGEDGRITKQSGSGDGVQRRLPHLGDNGKGVNRPQAREPGVCRQRPDLGNDGKGVNHAGTREPGVSTKRPHLGNNGQGVNRPQAREPGVKRRLPHLGDDGKGVNRPQAKEPGVAQDNSDTNDFHPMTMPEVLRWFQFLSARLRHVRILNGDWTRAVTTGATLSLSVRQGHGPCGVFLDPPYDQGERADGIYSHDEAGLAAAVRAWCLARTDDPRYRIVLAGFEGEGHEELEACGWRVVEWFKTGFLKGGMGNVANNGTTSQQKRERLWLSPSCLRPAPKAQQRGLFDESSPDEEED